MLPGLWISPGMIPIFVSPGVMIPGQFGPSSVELDPSTYLRARTMSRTGTPSVIATTSSTPASTASQIASAANGGGTKMHDTVAPVSSIASRTVL